MSTMKVTTKRQATLPKRLCEEMNIRPGDRLEVEPIEHDGERLWTIRLVGAPTLSFFASLRKYAIGKSDDWEEIRRRGAEAWGKEGAR